ncbi:helix-turn-helix transcriptional regulator [Enterocloster clostridioformis]
MSIGNRIKNCRTENQFTQKELANKLGLTPKMVSFYENDERIPPADILVKLASIFKVSTDYLLGMVEQKMPYGISSYSGQNESTGKSILFWIRKTGLGDDEVAEMLGISEELLKSYYAGESMPLDTLIKLSEICEVSTDCLLGIREKTRPKQDGKYPFQFDPEISRRLKDQMQRMGESYSQIAATIGIEEEEMFDFLEYGFVPHISVFAQIVEHFLVSSDFLLNRTGSTITIQEDEEELLLSYRALNSKSKTMALSRIYELEREEESLVAAKNRYLDREGKSLPSSGTGGGTMVG